MRFSVWPAHFLIRLQGNAILHLPVHHILVVPPPVQPTSAPRPTLGRVLMMWPILNFPFAEQVRRGRLHRTVERAS